MLLSLFKIFTHDSMDKILYWFCQSACLRYSNQNVNIVEDQKNKFKNQKGLINNG